MKKSLLVVVQLGVCLVALATWGPASEAQTTPEQLKKSGQRPVVTNKPVVKQTTTVRRTVTTTPKISKPVVVSKPKTIVTKPTVTKETKVLTKVRPVIAKPKTDPKIVTTPKTTTPVVTKTGPGVTGKTVATGVAVGAGAAALIAANNAKASTPIKQPYVTKLNAPFKSKVVQAPLKIKPVGFIKPVKIVHNPYLLAGARGQKFGYKPFWYQHNGVRWYRTYYPYLAAGGIWYWYWYNYSAVDAPVVYVDNSDLIDCDPDDDDCG